MSEFLIRPSVGSAIARPRTYLNIVLDKSSSMSEVRQETIAAYNALLEVQRVDRVDDLFVTLTQFSDSPKVVYKAVPVAEVRPLEERAYVPQGCTALYDGVYATLSAMEHAVGLDARVLTVVITDGEDNHSREVKTANQLRRIIQTYEARGNWTFVFLGAGPDAYGAGAAMGFAKGNVQAYTTAHMSDALATIARGVTGYRHSDSPQTADFYTARKFRRTQWVQDADDGSG